MELIAKGKTQTTVIRKQALVVMCDRFLNPDDKKGLVDSIADGLENGMVFLPLGVKAITVDRDCVVFMEEQE